MTDVPQNLGPDANGAINGLSQQLKEDSADLIHMSKNQRKKLKRKQIWEEGKEDRKAKRREKIKAARARKREARAQDADVICHVRRPKSQNVPVTFIIDCQYDGLMADYEISSLGTQITRSYSDNRKSSLRPRLCITSFEGQLKERFDKILDGRHRKWTGVTFSDAGITETCKESSEWMDTQSSAAALGALEISDLTADQLANPSEVIYLTSDSPETLHTLKPFGVYIIGGLVDKNRYKGLCKQRAEEAGIRTAKLPISEYFKMSSRKVLATCHVNEIMHKWLELGDWGKAFEQVIPKRKGGVRHDTDITEDRNMNRDSEDADGSIGELGQDFGVSDDESDTQEAPDELQ